MHVPFTYCINLYIHTSTLYIGIKKDITDLETKINQYNTISETSLSNIETEIQRLQASTASKYDIAQQAETSPKKINNIQKLFKDGKDI